LRAAGASVGTGKEKFLERPANRAEAANTARAQAGRAV